MASKEYVIESDFIPQNLIKTSILLKHKKPNYIEDFLKPFLEFLPDDLTKEFRLPVKIRENERNKYNPLLRLAKPEEASIIANIVKDDYEGTYPYKEMENPIEIQRMIETGDYKFILFLDDKGTIMGSTCFVLDFPKKKGYLRSLVVKKEFIGYLDTTKAYITACLMIWCKYRDKILIWWGEARTADSKSQYINRLCAVRPIAWLPNKDIFYNKIESDLMMIAYSRDVIKKYRTKKIPKIIRSIIQCYTFADSQYKLGEYIVENPSIKLNSKKLKNLNREIKITQKSDKNGYIKFKMTFKNTRSFFNFLYTPRVKNFEKTEYKVNNLEELFVYIHNFLKLASKLNVRYIEAHVSAYVPSHQKLFVYFNMKPRGYIPSWKNEKHNLDFKDYILVNHYSNKLFNKIQLIPEARLLINELDLS
ncbi:MAG: hypothetical protein GF311_01325 [Candidatus Lokiarchaeota archaeon]|nr:hypothetical protein [Candidatus Lokiarchaeota archaeon]